MLTNSNKGMYIEQLVDRTINFYQTNNIGLLEKRQIPIKILKHINETTVIAKLTAKAKVDYFGYINQKYIEIECKQTIHEYFDIALIKKHQLNYLKSLNYQSCYSYILVYFEMYNKVVAISYDSLIKCKTKIKKNKIPFKEFCE